MIFWGFIDVLQALLAYMRHVAHYNFLHIILIHFDGDLLNLHDVLSSYL